MKSDAELTGSCPANRSLLRMYLRTRVLKVTVHQDNVRKDVAGWGEGDRGKERMSDMGFIAK